MMRRLLLITAVCLAACSKAKIPKDILPPEKMQAVYWDYLQADAFANEFVRRDTSKTIETESAKLQLQVFKIHKVSKEEFYKSFEFYLNHREMLKDMLDTMLVRQNKPAETSTNSNGVMKRDSTKLLKTDSTRFFPRKKLPDTIKKPNE